jgi:hypothetical protein
MIHCEGSSRLSRVLGPTRGFSNGHRGIVRQRRPSNLNLLPAAVRPEEGEGDDDDMPSPAPALLTTQQAFQSTTGRTAGHLRLRSSPWLAYMYVTHVGHCRPCLSLLCRPCSQEARNLPLVSGTLQQDSRIKELFMYFKPFGDPLYKVSFLSFQRQILRFAERFEVIYRQPSPTW